MVNTLKTETIAEKLVNILFEIDFVILARLYTFLDGVLHPL